MVVDLPFNIELLFKLTPADDITLCNRLMSDLEMIQQGAFHPLAGFMTLEQYRGVMESLTLPCGSICSLPVCLPMKLSDCPSRNVNNENRILNLRDESGAVVAKMSIESVWRPDLKLEQQLVLGTNDSNHPWIIYQNSLVKEGDIVYVGGSIVSTEHKIEHYDFVHLRLPAGVVRKMLEKEGVQTVVGFQTRNPMHRAHFELTVLALKQVLDDDSNAELMITPAVGPTQDDDIAPEIRVHCYEKVLPKYQEIYGMRRPKLVLLPLSMRMAGPREALFHAMIRKNYGCTHFIVGRDHAGPSAKKADGSNFYGPYEAHDMMNKYSDKIGIKAILGQMVGYVGEEHGGFLPFDKIPKGVNVQTISGSEFRRLLVRCEPVPDFFSFPEVVHELRKHYKAKHNEGLVIYLTGLPCSGKSTLARALEAMIRERPDELRKVTILDGDLVRLNLSKGLGFSREDRSTNVRRIGFVASEIAKHGGIAVAANIAPFAEDRNFNRRMVKGNGGHYFEVYVKTPLEECERRDVKELYLKARQGIIKNFTGISDPYEVPENPELTIKTDESVCKTASRIIDALKSSEYIL